jgi:hypothetical protein
MLYASCPEGIFTLESYSVFFILITTSLISLNFVLPLSSLFTNLFISLFFVSFLASQSLCGVEFLRSSKDQSIESLLAFSFIPVITVPLSSLLKIFFYLFIFLLFLLFLAYFDEKKGDYKLVLLVLWPIFALVFILIFINFL